MTKLKKVISRTVANMTKLRETSHGLKLPQEGT